jgi:hypothetical protein
MEMTLTPVIDEDELSEPRRKLCNEVVRNRWPEAEVVACGTQGACSYTVAVRTGSMDGENRMKEIDLKEVCLREREKQIFENIRKSKNLEQFGRDEEEREAIRMTRGVESRSAIIQEKLKFIVQFRPQRFALDLDITRAAKETYGSYCPHVELVSSRSPPDIPGGLQMYALDFLPGVPYSQLQPRTRILDPSAMTKQSRLVCDFAHFIARAWPTSPQEQHSSSSRIGPRMTGKVGSLIPPKLAQLALHLPTPSLRHYASSILEQLPVIKQLPIVLNHGDVVPGNLMVSSITFELVGLVDWAEAEWLPFGTCLYGLEYLLGWLEHGTNPTFVYYEGAEELREMFWGALGKRVGVEGKEMAKWRGEVNLARDLGVLLWNGFAWDGGAIDRVVNVVDDREVVVCLEVFLEVGVGRKGARL